MPQFELALQILFTLARKTIEIYEYADNWDAKFCKESVIDSVTGLKEDKSFVKINPTKFSAHEMKNLGFGTWEDNGKYLIPLWIYPFLEEGFECESISGKIITFPYDKCDNDHRYGQTAYQVKPTDYKGE